MQDQVPTLNINMNEVEKGFKERCATIFTADNLGAISYYLQSCVPYPKQRVGENEFATIIAAAKYDGMQELIDTVINKVSHQ